MYFHNYCSAVGLRFFPCVCLSVCFSFSFIFHSSSLTSFESDGVTCVGQFRSDRTNNSVKLSSERCVAMARPQIQLPHQNKRLRWTISRFPSIPEANRKYLRLMQYSTGGERIKSIEMHLFLIRFNAYRVPFIELKCWRCWLHTLYS